MRLLAPNGPLRGEIELPVSKSIANRYQIISALAGKELPLPNSLPEDVRVLRDALVSNATEINIGMAGTAMRFLAAFYSVEDGMTHALSGNARMHERPIGDLVAALQSVGAEISYLKEQGFPPLEIRGKELKGGAIKMAASMSSQFVSALMMVAPKMKNGLTIQLEGKILSQPYIDLTADCMRQCGIMVQFQGNSIIIPAGNYHVPNLEFEADWSAASYFYAFAAARPNSKFLLKGLKLNSSQGDSILIDWFGKMGVSSVQKGIGVEISSSAAIHFPEELNFSDHPDLAQTFAFLAAALGKSLRLTGLDNLRLKETDRISAMKSELEKLGVSVSIEENSMTISGSVTVNEVRIATYNDHRMAMSAAVLSMVMPIEIENAGVVAKSFPEFWSAFKF